MSSRKPELDDQLAALAATGRTAAQIGRELGITRNTVIGRCRRRGFPLLNPSCHPVVKVAQQPKPKMEPICQPTVVQAQREWPPVTVLGLTSRTCRWPISDDPASPDFQYCGAPKELGPYCSRHGGLAYTPRGRDKVRRDAVRGSRFA